MFEILGYYNTLETYYIEDYVPVQSYDGATAVEAGEYNDEAYEVDISDEAYEMSLSD